MFTLLGVREHGGAAGADGGLPFGSAALHACESQHRQIAVSHGPLWVRTTVCPPDCNAFYPNYSEVFSATTPFLLEIVYSIVRERTRTPAEWSSVSRWFDFFTVRLLLSGSFIKKRKCEYRQTGLSKLPVILSAPFQFLLITDLLNFLLLADFSLKQFSFFFFF